MMRPEFRDAVLILEDELDSMLARPRLFSASVKCLALLFSHTLKLRARFASERTQVHHVMLEIAREMELEGGALGPIAVLVDKYGEAAVDEPQVLDFFRAWVQRCKTGR
jgi:hypothetical protein